MSRRWVLVFALLIDALVGVVLGVQCLVASEDWWYSSCSTGEICDRPNAGTDVLLRGIGLVMLTGALTAIVLGAVVTARRLTHRGWVTAALCAALVHLGFSALAQSHAGFTDGLIVARFAALVELASLVTFTIALPTTSASGPPVGER